MDNGKRSERSFKVPLQSLSYIFTPAHLTAIYTVLCILRRMKQQLGLEAMLEYLAKYLEAVEGPNPELKAAVAKALAVMDAEKMYKDAMKQKATFRVSGHPEVRGTE